MAALLLLLVLLILGGMQVHEDLQPPLPYLSNGSVPVQHHLADQGHRMPGSICRPDPHTLAAALPELQQFDCLDDRPPCPRDQGEWIVLERLARGQVRWLRGGELVFEHW